jgi:hypothetical protein
MVTHNDHNPFGLCTWDDSADCDACDLRDKLHCRWDAGVLSLFLAPAFAFSVVAAFGVGLASYVTGAWGMLAAYLAFFILFFLFVEIRILCSHCPYYGRDGFFLRCPANQGAPKLWRYRPQAMTRTESVGLVAGVAAATLVTLVAFAAVLTSYFCPHCVNFSCPLNRVPPTLREEYRGRNLVLQEGQHKQGDSST